MAPKKTAPVKQTALANWDEKLAAYATEAVAVTGSGGGSFISFKGGIISINKTPLEGNVLEAVVVAHLFENAWYPGKYDPDNPMPPDCFAFGDDPDTMAPHADSSNPQGMADPDTEKGRDKDGNILGKCADCWANQWASAEQGRGKACKNMRRLALIAGDEEALKTIGDEKIEFMKTTVTSSSAWDDHVKNVAATLNRPPFAIVTNITTAPDPKTQFRMIFKVNRSIEDPSLFDELIKKHEEALVKLPFPYSAMEEKPAPARTGPAKFAGRGKTTQAAPRGRGR
jgi:hypothetical protein